MTRRGAIHIDIVPKFKPGDLPPTGYVEWYEWPKSNAGRASGRHSACVAVVDG